jgi:hypothetical protein
MTRVPWVLILPALAGVVCLVGMMWSLDLFRRK